MNRLRGIKFLKFAWLFLLLPLAWAMRDVPLADTWAALAQLSPLSLLALIVFNLVILVLFSSRWWVILRSLGRPVPYFALVRYRLAAFSLSYFSPGPQFGGEPMQVHMLRSRHAMPLPNALASVTLDKLLELLVNFTFLLLGVLVILETEVLPGLSSTHILPLTVALLAVPLAYLGALWLGILPLARLLSALAARFSRPASLSKAAHAVLAAEIQVSTFFRQKPLAVLSALAFSVLNWALMSAEYWLTLHFLGISLGLPETIAALTAARFAFLVPVPGGIGALEASQVLAMQAMDLNPALGISLALLIRLRDLSLGAAGLLWMGLLPQRASTGTAISLPAEKAYVSVMIEE